MLDSGIGTLHSQGTGPIMETLLPDTIIYGGTSAIDASTPILRPDYRARPRPFGHEQTPIPDAPPPLSTLPRTPTGPGHVDPHQVIPAMVAQLQSDVHALRMLSPIHPNPVIGTRPVRRRTAKFMKTEVPKFRGNTWWNQHRQVLMRSSS